MRMKKLAIITAAIALTMPAAALAANNSNVQTVEAATKVHKCKLWMVDDRKGLLRVTKWKKSHKTFRGGFGSVTFDRAYYVPSEHKWEYGGTYKSKAKAMKVYKRVLKEDQEENNN